MVRLLSGLRPQSQLHVREPASAGQFHACAVREDYQSSRTGSERKATHRGGHFYFYFIFLALLGSPTYKFLRCDTYVIKMLFAMNMAIAYFIYCLPKTYFRL